MRISFLALIEEVVYMYISYLRSFNESSDGRCDLIRDVEAEISVRLTKSAPAWLVWTILKLN